MGITYFQIYLHGCGSVFVNSTNLSNGHNNSQPGMVISDISGGMPKKCNTCKQTLFVGYWIVKWQYYSHYQALANENDTLTLTKYFLSFSYNSIIMLLVYSGLR